MKTMVLYILDLHQGVFQRFPINFTTWIVYSDSNLVAKLSQSLQTLVWHHLLASQLIPIYHYIENHSYKKCYKHLLPEVFPD